MNLSLNIRPACKQDAAVLSQLAIRSKAHWGYSDDFMQACEDELSVNVDAISDYWLAESLTEILGFYALTKISCLQYELDAMFVDPVHIGAGVGRALFLHAKEVAFDKGATSLLIQSDPNAAPFYIGLGGVLVGEKASGSIVGRMLPTFEVALTGDS